MASLENFRAFALAAELGSFSAAARKLKKAQSAISTSIANLEIDVGLELFDRSGRSPVLTDAGRALLPNAKGILLGTQEFLAKATSLSEGVEGKLCIALEDSVSIRPLLDVLQKFSVTFPQLTFEVVTVGSSEIAKLLREGGIDLGIMIEQEHYPLGFQFRGVGYSKLVPVCGRHHPLAELSQIRHADLRQYRELLFQTRSQNETPEARDRKSVSVWRVGSLSTLTDLLAAGFGWAEIPYTIAADQIEAGDLVRLPYAFQQSDILEGIDVVWTEQRALGVAGQWMLDQLLDLPQDVWREV